MWVCIGLAVLAALYFGYRYFTKNNTAAKTAPEQRNAGTTGKAGDTGRLMADTAETGAASINA